MKLNIEWRDDCQGKKDYDGDIVSVSTRYWPGGYQANGLCSAECTILLLDGYKNRNGENAPLVSKDFEGETSAQVAAQVEEWAHEQANRVYSALWTEFGCSNVDSDKNTQVGLEEQVVNGVLCYRSRTGDEWLQFTPEALTTAYIAMKGVADQRGKDADKANDMLINIQKMLDSKFA